MRDFHAGDIVGAYRLEARLGGGGFGSVWRARNVASGSVVALKLLPDLEGNEEAARLAAEIELLAASAASNSRHVVRVLDGGVDPIPHVVMEFISGTSLEEELRQRRRLSQAEVIDIGLGVADALRGLDAVGIVHRDVKPSNVMIDRAGVVKLTDFGIAKIVGFDAATLTGQMPLSIGYAAPEVWEGRAEHRSDLYALGIVLYQCLSGALPFRGGYAELFYHHRSTEPDLSSLPLETAPALAELIRISMRKEPGERPASARVCIDLLEKAKTELQASAPASAASALPEPDRFGPWLKLDPDAEQPWTWHCRHERTGQLALVELRTAPSPQYGDVLRAAVAANPRLTPLGGQRLLGANRFILRPGEAWPAPPAGGFQFWIAREEMEALAPPARVNAATLLRAVDSLIALIAAARDAAVPLSLAPARVALLPDGSVSVRDAGLPGEGTSDPEAEAIAFLRSLPLTAELRHIVDDISELEGIRKAVAILVTVRPAQTAGSGGRARRRLPAGATRGASLWLRIVLVSAFAGLAAAAVLGALLLSGGDDGNGGGGEVVTPPPTAVPQDDPAVKACTALPLPATLADARAACGPAGATFAQDDACARGEACKLTPASAASAVAVGANLRTLAYVDPSGNLSISADDASNARALTAHGQAQDPAWSPDGRYLAYVQVVPLPGQDGTSPQRFSTQLRIVSAAGSADDSIFVATNTAESQADWQRLHIISPRWAPDGRSIYFLWAQPGGRGERLMNLQIPFQGQSTNINFNGLRTGISPEDVVLPAGLSSVDITADDFGISDGYFGRFKLAEEGALYVQVCDRPIEERRCGLGRWDGQFSLLAEPQDNIAFAPPAGPDASGVLFVPEWRRGEGWHLIRIAETGEPVDGAGAALFAPETGLGIDVPRVALAADGKGVLAEGAGTALRLIATDGTETRVAAGRSPATYRSPLGQPGPSAPSLTVEPYATPSATATPVATATPTVTPVPASRPMTLSIGVRRSSAPQANAEVIAFIGADECARGTTDSGGRLTLTLPRAGASAGCNVAGASIRFRVNGIENLLVTPSPTLFSPQGFTPVDITLP